MLPLKLTNYRKLKLIVSQKHDISGSKAVTTVTVAPIQSAHRFNGHPELINTGIAHPKFKYRLRIEMASSAS